MSGIITYISLLVLSVTSTRAFSPNVTIVNCNARKVTVEIENAAEGGLVYIQGGGDSCSKSTSSLKSQHQFDFETCSIDYDSKFRLIIQRHKMYQTGHDKVIPVMCLVDTSDIFVSSVIFPEESTDKSINKTIRPIISMSMLTENETGQLPEVTLNDKVKLNLELDPQYVGVFDIKAMECTASYIPILEDECSTDAELFPNFVRRGQGQIVSTFNAFQPRNMPGDVDVVVGFTCTVSVCKGSCDQTICGEIVGWGRRKRNAKEKIIEDVQVGTKLKIKVPRNEEAVQSETSEYCAEKMIVTSVSTVVIVTLVFSWMICGCALCKLRSSGGEKSSGPKMPSAMRRISEINVNFAKSVGRRLSTMLHLPSGYSMDDKVIVDNDLGFDNPSSRRRDSVTVRSEDSFILRRRLVTSATQTDESMDDIKKSESLTYDKSNSIKLLADSTMRHKSNPITSISISSAATKTPKDFPRQNSESFLINKNDPRHSGTFSRSATFGGLADNHPKGRDTETSDPIIYHDADEVPRARKPYVGVIQVRANSDTSCSGTADSVVSHVEIGGTTHEDGDIPRSAILCDDMNLDDNVFESHTSKKKLLTRQVATIADNDASKDAKQVIQCNATGYDALADVYSVIEKHQLYDRDERHNTIVSISIDSDVSDKIDFVDDVYEAVEIGGQMKRERKYSTHV